MDQYFKKGKQVSTARLQPTKEKLLDDHTEGPSKSGKTYDFVCAGDVSKSIHDRDREEPTQAEEFDSDEYEKDCAVAKIDGPSTVEAMEEETMKEYLRQFDLNPKFGPFVGISREGRWQRAERFGLEPPQLVMEIAETNRFNDTGEVLGFYGKLSARTD